VCRSQLISAPVRRSSLRSPRARALDRISWLHCRRSRLFASFSFWRSLLSRRVSSSALRSLGRGPNCLLRSAQSRVSPRARLQSAYETPSLSHRSLMHARAKRARRRVPAPASVSGTSRSRHGRPKPERESSASHSMHVRLGSTRSPWESRGVLVGGASRSKRLARAVVVCARGSMRVSELAAVGYRDSTQAEIS